MDLVSIAQTLWRYKKLVIPVMLLTVVGAIYVVKIKPPIYQTTASVLLTNPQTGATESQVKADPGLKNANPYNTFVSFGNLTVVANAVMDLITSPAEADTLVKQNIGDFTLSLSSDYGNPPIIDIVAEGKTAPGAIQSAKALVEIVNTDLAALQKSEGVNSFYLISGTELVKPVQANPSSSGKSRSLIAILAVGALFLLIVVSVADTLEKRRRSAGLKNDAKQDDDSPWNGDPRGGPGQPGPRPHEPEFTDRMAPGPSPASGRSQSNQDDYWPAPGFTPRR
jgi:capsular polysaccharide biosynthesis protein